MSDTESLDEALDGVSGPVRVVLPTGITEHETPITRAAPTVVQGQGEGLTTIRPRTDGPLVDQTEPYDGDLVFRDLTIDRDHRPGRRDGAEAADIVFTSAGGRFEFHDVTMERFDFGGRKGGAVLNATNHPDGVGFHNLTVDFQTGGGVTHRHPGGDWDIVQTYQGETDRLLVDENCTFVGHLIQHVDPETVVDRADVDDYLDHRGIGGIAGFGGKIHEYASIDGEFRDWDYGVWRQGGPAAPDATLEFRCDVIGAGYADVFWPQAVVPDEVAGHVTYDGVTITSAPDNPWHDRGIKTVAGEWVEGNGFRSVTIDGCTIAGRATPIEIQGGGVDQLSITDTTVSTRGGRHHRGVLVNSTHNPIGSVTISGLHVRPHQDADAYQRAIELSETEPWGPVHTVSDVLAIGYTQSVIVDDTADDTEVRTSNVVGVDVGELPGAESLGTIPNRAIDVNGGAS